MNNQIVVSPIAKVPKVMKVHLFLPSSIHPFILFIHSCIFQSIYLSTLNKLYHKISELQEILDSIQSSTFILQMKNTETQSIAVREGLRVQPSTLSFEGRDINNVQRSKCRCCRSHFSSRWFLKAFLKCFCDICCICLAKCIPPWPIGT